MSSNGIGEAVAFTAITGATGAQTGKTLGVSGVVRNGAGDYTVTLAGGGIDPLDAACSASIAGAGVAAGISVVHSADTTIQILTTDDAGAAADFNCQLCVERIGIG